MASESASIIIRRREEGSHDWSLKNYSILRKGVKKPNAIKSDAFMACGHRWTILLYPNGNNFAYSWSVSLFLSLQSSSSDPVEVSTRLILVDQSVKGNHWVKDYGYVSFLKPGFLRGFDDYITRAELEYVPYLKDDCLNIRCVIRVCTCHIQKLPLFNHDSSSNTIGADFRKLLERKESADVLFKVGDEMFWGHKLILVASSPLFRSRLLDHQSEIVVIPDMEPRIFKAMLWFIYTGNLEDEEQKTISCSYLSLVDSFMGKVLAAAHQFELKNLKRVCESRISEQLSAESVAYWLHLADIYHATELKAACLRFAAGNEDAVLESEGCEYLRQSCPSLFLEVAYRNPSSSGGGEETRNEKGLHRLTFEKYSLYEGIGKEKHVDSDAFTVGGHRWVVVVSPELWTNPTDNCPLGVYLGLRIKLVSEKGDGVRCFHRMTLLDQSGKGNHLTQSFPALAGPIIPGESMGYPHFIERDRLVKSSYLKDDCLKIECMIDVVSTPEATIARPRSDDDDVGVCFLSMLDTGEGSDVAFSVRGEKFRAHKFIMSARSSVFRSMFAVSDQQETFVIGMEPRVFKALLHFIYSDTLPEDERPGFGFGPCLSSTFGAKLLVAAVDYDLKRLKSICEAHIWRNISLGRVAETILLAERCNASALKRLCFKYAADSYAVLVESDGFRYLRDNCPLLLNEVEDYYVTEMKKQDLFSSKEW